MNKLMMTGATIAALLTGGLLATPVLASKAAPVEATGVLHVYGNDGEAKLFTADGISRAETAMNNTSFDHGLTVTLDLYAKVPEGKTVPEDEAGKAKFFRDWAAERATDDKAKGVYILVCRKPGYIEVIADKDDPRSWFLARKRETTSRQTTHSFRSSAAAKQDGKPDAEQFKLRDDGLVAAIGFIVSDLKDTSVTTTTGKNLDAQRYREEGSGRWRLGLPGSVRAARRLAHDRPDPGVDRRWRRWWRWLWRRWRWWRRRVRFVAAWRPLRCDGGDVHLQQHVRPRRHVRRLRRLRRGQLRQQRKWRHRRHGWRRRLQWRLGCRWRLRQRWW